MKLINNIHFRVFCNQDEDKIKIKSAFLNLIGFREENMIVEKIKFSETVAQGFNKNKISILEADFLKERHCNQFLKRLNDLLDNNQKKILLEQENRLDDNMNFFIRFDKMALIAGKYILTDSGNCFHITMNIETHPRRRDVALKIVNSMFTDNKIAK
ncbi:MAG: RNA-binding domain-containing protein [Candidatus Woesearchaeota archaeon]|jgi:RNA binding exosome subunit